MSKECVEHTSSTRQSIFNENTLNKKTVLSFTTPVSIRQLGYKSHVSLLLWYARFWVFFFISHPMKTVDVVRFEPVSPSRDSGSQVTLSPSAPTYPECLQQTTIITDPKNTYLS